MNKMPKRGIWLAVSLICLMLFGRRTDAMETSGNKVTPVFPEKQGFYQEDNASEIYTHTYFLGEDVKERFSTWVIAITSDPVNLYDDENGILVGGRMKREYLESHPEEEEAVVYQQELARKDGVLSDGEQESVLQE
mgnify:CR=1 FL=1